MKSEENKVTEIVNDDVIEKEIEKSVEAESQLVHDDTSEIIQDAAIDDKFKRLNLFFEQEKARTADMASRQEYLRTQRDKILQIKKQARARQLYETTKDRPKSAVAAQKIIDGESFEADESSVHVRKMLAKKLRDEVVNKTGSMTTGEES